MFGFVLFAGLGREMISYLAVLFLFLPCLYLLSRVVRLRWYSAGLIGLALGIAIFFPMSWMDFRSSGADSGPPQGTFLEFLWHARTDVMNLIFPSAAW